ncbi:hypothetical protein [Paenibacillus methanolicus]|uniref:hypothetical protein n=1 Tax=Paenibacillus methanolicus TaxID=582686 RepID=UPI0011E6CAFF|nr:hypothetical protein [Paenibacillus methanolicus]
MLGGRLRSNPAWGRQSNRLWETKTDRLGRPVRIKPAPAVPTRASAFLPVPDTYALSASSDRRRAVGTARRKLRAQAGKRPAAGASAYR